MYVLKIGSAALLLEGNGAAFHIHGIHNSQGLHEITHIPNHSATDPETLFNYNTAAFCDGTGILGNADPFLRGAAVDRKIIDDQNVPAFMEELPGYDDLLFILVCERLHLSDKLMDLDFLANTMGTSNSLVTQAAMSIPDDSIVITLMTVFDRNGA